MVKKEFRAGQVYRENRMLPVLSSPSGVSSKVGEVLTKENKRHTVRGEDLYCILVEPNGSDAIFIDESGRDYVISREELNSTIKYKNSAFEDRIIPSYVVRRGVKGKLS